MIEMKRRAFIGGLIALVAAPAIVRAGSLMPVKTVVERFTEADFAELMDRLYARGQMHDLQYAQAFGMPVMGEIDPKTRMVIQ